MSLAAARTADFSEIPVIPLGELGGSAEAVTVRAIREACETVGFFYVSDHGVPAGLIDGLFAQSRRFFELPQAARDALAVTRSKNYRGYVPIDVLGEDRSRQRELRHSLNVGYEPAPGETRDGDPLFGPNQWPGDLPGFRETVIAYYSQLEHLMGRLLAAFALALELPRDAFAADFRRPLTQLRLLHYPPQEGEITGDHIGARPHADSGIFTILLQDAMGGLEVRNHAGEWIAAPPRPQQFVVNIGDMLKLMTGGRFASTVHRVVNRSGKERYSFPFFVNPDFAAIVRPPAGMEGEPIPVGPHMQGFYRRMWPSVEG